MRWVDPKGLNGTVVPLPIPKPEPRPIWRTLPKWITLPITGPIAIAIVVGGAIVLYPSDIATEEDCAAEWKEAYRQCSEELAKRDPCKGITGGYTNLHDCARGLVSERCGGNPVQW